MFSWWPASYPTEIIPTLRSIGRRNIRWFDDPKAPPVLRDHIVLKPVWDGTLTLTEQRLMRLLHEKLDVLVPFARLLAAGPKLFRMPTEVEDGLDAIEIPLVVKDFAPPFPTCLVERPNSEVHLVDFQTDVLQVLKLSKKAGDVFDYMVMVNRSGKTIDAYFSETQITNRDNRVLLLPDEAFRAHKFRATLNWLLFCTMEGLLSDGHVAKPRDVRHNRILKMTNPEVFKPQNIRLFRERSYSDPTENSGSGKRPHWRRAHWARVRVGPGRLERKLILRRCSFINKDRLANPDDVDSLVYTASAG